MAVLINDILPSAVYNTLPHIDDVMRVPEENANDIADLTALLERYKLDDRVRIKLIHIHFHLKEGEVFAARDVTVPNFGLTNIMQAVPAKKHQPLYGHHYFVNSDGDLAAYEYMSQPGPDISQYRSFIREFCQIVRKRRLQHKLGLSLRHAKQVHGTSELEYPGKRTCIDVPAEVPLPYSSHGFDTTTEFSRESATIKNSLKNEQGTELAKQHLPGKCNVYCKYSKHRFDEAELGLSDGNTTIDNDSSDGHITSDTDDSESSSDHDDFDRGHGLYVIDRRSRQINLAGRKLDSRAALYKIVSFVSDIL
ncbi:hypothetical protein LTR22_022747 [Elasticomyces elasticus]|nr:hypothetical protein LTR22_022747 [Elasticomyces elasticus]KAK4907630.1 hypothetical protein LTR49_023383 [Elasticomyces elasticus]KAK5753450.1 hypothetical protein LTS12_016501 [Elasticomyces elasticus]